MLVGCDDDEKERPVRPSKPIGAIVSETVTGTAVGAVDIVKEPFKDIGLSKDDIPQILEGLSDNPYIMPGAPICENLKIEMVALNKTLGMDVDAAHDSKTSYTEEGIEAAQHKASDMMRSEVQVLPFRGVVRRISGAEKHARKVAAAYEAGKLRRAFLKGLNRAYECGLDKKY